MHHAKNYTLSHSNKIKFSASRRRKWHWHFMFKISQMINMARKEPSSWFPILSQQKLIMYSIVKENKTSIFYKQNSRFQNDENDNEIWNISFAHIIIINPFTFCALYRFLLDNLASSLKLDKIWIHFDKLWLWR